jgi:hypothetical protein
MRRSRLIEILNVQLRFSEGGSTGGVFPFAKIHGMGKRPHEVRRYLLRSSLAAALPAEWRVLACRGWAGEKDGLFEHPARDMTVIRELQKLL